MSASGGVVLLSAAQDRAVYLTGSDLATVRETLDVIVRRPTVAGGPLDPAGLERLARAIELAEEDDAPTILSAVEEAGLELIKNQAGIRTNLPLRIRYTCTECGHEHVVNPARQARAAAPTSGRSGPDLDTVATSLSLLGDGHPFLATLNLFGGGDDSGGQNPASPAESPICARCDGEKFDVAVITICPGCRSFRAESVLLTCPECRFDFGTRTVAGEFWVTPQRARADAALAGNVALLREKAASFENNLWPGQLRTLIAALRPDERLHAMCRCGLPNQVGRYVALLLTDRQLVWTRESPVSAATGGSVPWSEVLAVRPHHGNSATEHGVRIDVRDATTLVFKDFRGAGVPFGKEPASFTADAVYTLVHRLWRPGQPVAAVAPEPAPAATPTPGWYPDPWRAARLRWWDGVRWTGHLSP